MVVDDDRRGDREAFANAEEVEVLVDDVVVPVDFAGVGIARLGADRDGCLQCRDLGWRQFRRKVMGGVLPGDRLARGIERGGRPIVEVGIGEGNDAERGRIDRRTVGYVRKFTGRIRQNRASGIDHRQIVGSREDHRHLLGRAVAKGEPA